jgi:hypothetical protein
MGGAVGVNTLRQCLMNAEECLCCELCTAAHGQPLSRSGRRLHWVSEWKGQYDMLHGASFIHLEIARNMLLFVAG